jgi:hypothetical protein
LLTVAELPSYLRVADKLLGEDERKEIVQYLAAHPSAGALIQGTGGVRKLRWSREGRGNPDGHPNSPTCGHLKLPHLK